MNKSFRQAARALLPFPVRRWLAGVRAARGFSNVFGRARSGGLHASISRRASARLWRHVSIGRECIVDDGVCFHTNDNGDGLRIRIDDGCFIGRNSFFSAGESIHIKPHCNVGASCNLLAAGHEYDDPTTPCCTSPVVSYGHMELGTNTWIGVGATLVGGIRVGYGSIVAAGSLLRQSLPPLCMAAGVPAAPVKLYDWPSGRWIRVPPEGPDLKAALERHLATIPTEAEYAHLLKH